MSKKANQYDEKFKKNIVSLHQNGKTITELTKEYGISHSKTDTGVAKAKRSTGGRESHIKKAIAIFTPHSG